MRAALYPWWQTEICAPPPTPTSLYISMSLISQFTRPVLREQIRVYSLLLASRTFHNNNNRRCLDLQAAMATGIRQGLLLCWWCPQEESEQNNNNKWANWQCVSVYGPVCPLCLSDDQLCSIESHNKGLARKPLCVIVSQELCEILWQLVYPIQNRAGLGEGNVCLWFRL